MLYIASRRQNMDTTTWEDAHTAPTESKGKFWCDFVAIGEGLELLLLLLYVRHYILDEVKPRLG